MKKFVFILFIIMLLFISKNDKKYIIPNNAIRFRIIANSNNINDQLTKTTLKEEIEVELKKVLIDAKNYQDAQRILKENLGLVENIVKNKANDYHLQLGLNYFPEKEYKNVVYPEGIYESLVITLGEGLGNNWWCVLYPPLCFIDEENITDNDYHLFIKDLFNKIKLQ